jgi:hypothetical protein
MDFKFDVVVSSENNQYMAWQTQLFCFSARSRLGLSPVVVVHKDKTALRPEFTSLTTRGFQVVTAPSFKQHPSEIYPARNQLGSLLTAASLTRFSQDHILFCEPDMLFIRPPKYNKPLVAAFYDYLDYGEDRVKTVAKKFGLEGRIDVLNREAQIGVPYFIPVCELERLSRRWFDVLDSFESLKWIDIMYAFGIAAMLEDVHVDVAYNMFTNRHQLKPITGDILHYCLGDYLWSKRSFWEWSPLVLRDEYLPWASEGTVLYSIGVQLREAKRFFYEDH